MFESEEERRKNVFTYNPISLLYLVFLGFVTLFMLPYLIFAGALVGRALSIPSYLVFIIFLLSLFGSQINIKLKETRSLQPSITYRTVNFFGIQCRIPEAGYGNKKMVIAINLGGAIIPLLLSLFIIFYSVPALEQNLTLAYLKILVAFIIVTFVVHHFAKPIKGLGIAIPSFIPPITAALTSAILFSLVAETNPFIIAYVAGTLGTLVGADLLNINKIPKLGAPMVSIGGAGVFDGVYITGVMAIFLLSLIV
jgi:uncharacterized membrane protein